MLVMALAVATAVTAACGERASSSQALDLGAMPPGFETVLEAAIEPPRSTATLERVASSCGCVDLSLLSESSPCPPGTKLFPHTKDLRLRLTYRRLPAEPTGKRQETVKLFFVDSETGDRREHEVLVRGSVDSELSLVAGIEPPAPVDLAESNCAVVRIKLRRAVPLAQVRVTSPSAIKVGVAAAAGECTDATADLAIDCSDLTLGTHAVHLELPFRADARELVKAEVRATVDARPEPSRIVQRVGRGQQASGAILVRGRLFAASSLKAVVEPVARDADGRGTGFQVQVDRAEAVDAETVRLPFRIDAGTRPALYQGSIRLSSTKLPTARLDVPYTVKVQV